MGAAVVTVNEGGEEHYMFKEGHNPDGLQTVTIEDDGPDQYMFERGDGAAAQSTPARVNFQSGPVASPLREGQFSNSQSEGQGRAEGTPAKVNIRGPSRPTSDK